MPRARRAPLTCAMRVTIIAIGSLGDVAPYTGLGQGLAGRGHVVTIATHDRFRDLVASAGLRHFSLPMDPRAELTPEHAAKISGNSIGSMRALEALYRPWVPRLAAAIDAAAVGADVLLLSALAWIGFHVGLGRGIPTIGLPLQPFEPTSAFGPPALGRASWGGPLNRALGRTVARQMVAPWIDTVNEIRARHGLASITVREHFAALAAHHFRVLHGYSPSVLPRPRDWRPEIEVVGYWWPAVPTNWIAPAQLVDFLAAGRPPIYIGFGSTVPGSPDRLDHAVREALEATGQRAIVQKGWAGLSVAGEDVHVIEDVPHSWLFPQLACAVHHAGAGTTAAALRAGIPAVTVPVSVDQPFWARRLHDLGAAPPPIPAKKLTGARLTAALARISSDPSYTNRARTLSQRLNAEDATARVAAAIGLTGEQ